LRKPIFCHGLLVVCGYGALKGYMCPKKKTAIEPLLPAGAYVPMSPA